jgi:hypothetical protein
MLGGYLSKEANLATGYLSSCERWHLLIKVASDAHALFPPPLGFPLLSLSFILPFSFLSFSQDSSTVSIPSQAESSRATPTLPACSKEKHLATA